MFVKLINERGISYPLSRMGVFENKCNSENSKMVVKKSERV